MNKNELAAKVAEETGLNNSQAKEALEATLKAITGALASGEEVSLAGFGKFAPKERPERQGKNPQTGEAMTIAAATQAKFSPASALKQALNS